MVTGMVSNSPSAYWGFSMGKQNNVKDKVSTDVTAVTGDIAQATPKMALAGPQSNTDTPAAPSLPRVIPMQHVTVPKIALSDIDSPHIATEHVAPRLPFPENSGHDSANEKLDQPPALLRSSAESDSTAEADSVDPPATDGNAPAAAPENASPRVSRFSLLAACLALAAALGGMVGAVAAFSLARPAPSPVITAGKFPVEEIQALKENIVQARVELAALKVSIDTGNRLATTQFTKLAERIERMERNAAEPAAKLNKAVENIERIARAENAAALKEATGSIAPPPAAAPKPAALEGWILRDVHRGTAYLESRNGILEVEQGDLVPGLGRIDAIRKQDGRWVVVTSKGTITATSR
jgi:hypothetical protein